jgi:2-amino-4-hydroxy-6-hydroxymethyldihydropteridine diphosphokinase
MTGAAVLSLGSNLGDRLAHLQLALYLLRPAVTAVSPVYETAPWGPVPQDDFLNAVVLVSDRRADAREWLRRAQAAEQAAERTREQRWGPRTLDVDVIAVDAVSCDEPDLTVPHPRAAERAFVLVPWLDVQPEAYLAGRPVRELLSLLPESELASVRRRDDLRLTL